MKSRILLIDDSRTQLSSLKFLLSKSGYEVITAIDGISGIQAAYESNPDLIVSDIVMPHINGYQLCRLLKDDKNTKDIPIILLTNLDKKIDKFWGMRAGAEAYVAKDSNPDELIDQINKTLSKIPVDCKASLKEIPTGFRMEDVNIQSRINDILDQALIESTIMNEFRNLSEFILDPETLYRGVFSLLSSILDYHVAGIFFNSRDQKKEKILYLNTNECSVGENVLARITDEFFSNVFTTFCPIERNIFNFEEIEKSHESSNVINNIANFNSKIVIPIEYNDKLLGGICLFHTEPEKYSSSRIFDIVLNELKLLMRIKWLNSETKFLAITDELTGLYNRRYLQQALEREFARSKRYSSPLSVAMFDLDRFKNLNDTYGHQFGDKVLAEISNLILKSLRKSDYVARYGGEEIVAILPETDLINAIIPIERIRKAVEKHEFYACGQKINVTISVGISTNSDKIIDERELLRFADEALYTAKANGRNRVEVYQPETRSLQS